MDSARLRLIVGLGNPGREYAGTRHNIGFTVLDEIASRNGFAFRGEARWKGEFATHENIMYLKPATFMNLSGEAVAAVARFYRLVASEILVVFDDTALPVGRLRLRASGSAGGHNGLRSIIQHLGTQDIPRLRIGIGNADRGDRMTGHVLGHFRKEEIPFVQSAIERSAEAISFSLKNGLALGMNLYNKPETSPNT